MKRHIWGVIAATIVAPYLVGLSMSIYFEFDKLMSRGEASNFLNFLKFLPISTVALAIFGLPLLILSSLCAVLLKAIECQTKWSSILTGIILSFFYVTVATSSPAKLRDEWLAIIAISVLPGAICGWIYWAIAIKRTSEPSRAIDPA